MPEDPAIHLILDNYATHIHQDVRTWLPVDGQPPPQAAQLRRQNRSNRPGQPRIRPVGLLGRRRTGHLPAVSYLKAPGFQDGHPQWSAPLDEQQFLVETIKHLQKLPDWNDTAVVIAYDDSDGWYDHKPSPIVSASATPEDALTGPGACSAPTAAPITYQGRCGYGPCLTLLVISPYARANFVDHTRTDQTSILRFIEDNWKTGRIGDDSLDDRAGPLDALFELHRRHPADADAESAHGQPTVTAGTSCAHSAVRVRE